MIKIQFLILFTVSSVSFSFKYLEKMLYSIENPANKLKAVHRSDNDFITTNDNISGSETVPEKVTRIINRITDSVKANYGRPGYNKILNGIYKINVTSLISLYITKIYYYGDKPTYYIIAYDKGKNIVTVSPPGIQGYYMENNEAGFGFNERLLNPPLISFVDINSDGQNEIKIKERAHNGTVYNAEIDHYFEIDDKMDLHQVLCVESKSLLDMDLNCLIYRTLKQNILFDTLKCENSKPESIGKAVFQINRNSKILSKINDKESYDDYIITSNQTYPDSIFIRYGHNTK